MPYLAEPNYTNAPTLGNDAPLSPAERALMETEDEQFYIRCRRAILRLNDQLVKAAEERSEFAPFLLEAMRNAMAELLEHGDHRHLLLLEQWLDEETEVS
jgi:hypothetical protein